MWDAAADLLPYIVRSYGKHGTMDVPAWHAIQRHRIHRTGPLRVDGLLTGLLIAGNFLRSFQFCLTVQVPYLK